MPTQRVHCQQEENTNIKTSSTMVRMQKDRLTGRLLLSVFAAFWGAFQFGWNTGVINNPKDSIMVMVNDSTRYTFKRQLTDYELELIWSTIVSIFAIGGMIGSLMGGLFAERLGRKWGMLVNCVFGIVATLFMSLSFVANSFIMLIIGRFLVGFCCALYTCLVPLYITEVSHSKIRGGIGVLNQLGVVTGILLAQIFSIDDIFGSVTLWPLLLGLAAFPCLIQIVLLPFCPESPRHLVITKKRDDEALNVLIQLRGHSQIEKEMEAMKMERELLSTRVEIKCFDLLRYRRLWMPLVIGIVLHISQQFSGINVIFYYSSQLFKNVGVDEDIAKYSTIAVGIIMVVMTGVTVPLMDKLGRRTLHLVGLLGIVIFSMAFTTLFTIQNILQDAPDALSYASITSALVIVVFFALGPGSIPWLMMSEMFDQESRSTANSVGVLVNWSANFVVGLIFPVLSENLYTFLFLPFSAISLFCLILLFFIMPETKNKSIEHIISEFSKTTRTPSGRHKEDDLAEQTPVISKDGNDNAHYSSTSQSVETYRL